MSELVKTAEDYDVTICLENMPFTEFSLATPSDIIRVVETINNKHFQFCLDTGHVNVFNGLSPASTVRQFGKYIKAIHIHDNSGDRDAHLIPYYGTIDWADFGKALNEINFNGTFSFELDIPDKMPSPAFDEMSIALAKLAKTIITD